MGLPIILSLPMGEASEIIEETACGVVIPPEQPAQLVAAVLDLYQNTEKRQALSHAGTLAAQQYSRKQQADKMIKVLQKVVTSNSQIKKGNHSFENH